MIPATTHLQRDKRGTYNTRVRCPTRRRVRRPTGFHYGFREASGFVRGGVWSGDQSATYCQKRGVSASGMRVRGPDNRADPWRMPAGFRRSYHDPCEHARPVRRPGVTIGTGAAIAARTGRRAAQRRRCVCPVPGSGRRCFASLRHAKDAAPVRPALLSAFLPRLRAQFLLDNSTCDLL